MAEIQADECCDPVSRGSGLGRVLHSQVEAVSPFGVFFCARF